MDGGTSCPICFTEYTTEGSHRTVALKCGHLFGKDCIEKWMSVYKKNYCPTCSAPCRKSHLRIIFAAKVVANDKEKEKEFIDKYIKENELRKELEREIGKLKTQIEIMKTSNKQKTAVQEYKAPQIHMHLMGSSKIHFFPDDSLICYDPINQAVLITCLKNGQYGIFKYTASDFSIFSFIPFDSKVTSIEVSPFSDGLCLVSYSNKICLWNVYSENEVSTLVFENDICSVCFSKQNRQIVYCADIRGSFFICNLVTFSVDKYSICKENLHSIAETEDQIYVSNVFGIFVNNRDSPSSEFTKLELEINGICTSVTASDKNVLCIFREFGFNITGILLGQRFLSFNADVKQHSKHSDKIINGYAFITDDSRNKIKVLDLNTLQMVYSYSFKEKVVGYCGDSDYLIILTKKCAYVYNSR